MPEGGWTSYPVTEAVDCEAGTFAGLPYTGSLASIEAVDDLTVKFATYASSQKVKNAERDPRVDAVVAVSMFSPAVTAESPRNLLMIVGVLRGGGDTRYPMMIEMSLIWLFGVPAAFIGSRVLGLPLPLMIAVINIEEFIKALIMMKRLYSRKWINNVADSLSIS